MSWPRFVAFGAAGGLVGYLVARYVHGTMLALLWIALAVVVLVVMDRERRKLRQLMREYDRIRRELTRYDDEPPDRYP